jgi:hypothetical protein
MRLLIGPHLLCFDVWKWQKLGNSGGTSVIFTTPKRRCTQKIKWQWFLTICTFDENEVIETAPTPYRNNETGRHDSLMNILWRYAHACIPVSFHCCRKFMWPWTCGRSSWRFYLCSGCNRFESGLGHKTSQSFRGTLQFFQTISWIIPWSRRWLSYYSFQRWFLTYSTPSNFFSCYIVINYFNN